MALGYFQTSQDEVFQFTSEVQHFVTGEPQEVAEMIQHLEEACEKQGLWALGYLSYEGSRAFDPKLRTHRPHGPVLDFTLYETRQSLPLDDLKNALEGLPRAFLSPPKSSLSFSQYQEALGRIRQYLAQGETYQVNYTFPLLGQIMSSGGHLGDRSAPESEALLGLWVQLVQAQACRFGGYYRGQEATILSMSPELFFHRQGEAVFCRPMKGTRANTPGLNPATVHQELQGNPKDQAENLMIVDMIRNDLGKIAQPGSVKTKGLFHVEEYPSVFQMVTPIEAAFSGSLTSLLSALFPCASITGAPKNRTMGIIQELEGAPRGAYTGALGWIGPEREALFNVPIRTLVVDPESSANQGGLGPDSLGKYRFSVGSGVIWDSEPQAEYQECLVKARFLEAGYRQFDLIEALRWTPDGGPENLDQHLERMAASAHSLGESADPWRWKGLVQQFLDPKQRSEPLPAKPQKLKLSLDGRHWLDLRFLGEARSPEFFLYALAGDPLPQGQDFFLRNKTSRRQIYQEYLQAFPGADQVILYTSEGLLTEGTSANLYLKISGQWFTPPVHLPLLPGCHRARELASGRIRERELKRADLQAAEAVAFGNDVRGWVSGRSLLEQYTI
jgi:para-aminobenzoate synthetase/4-amino-4-deoxychorismate lyase